MQVTTLHRAANEYNTQFKLPLPTISLKSGDVVWVAVWARMLHSGDESGQGVLGIVLEQKEEPFSKLVQHRVSVGTQWQEFAFPAGQQGLFAWFAAIGVAGRSCRANARDRRGAVCPL